MERRLCVALLVLSVLAVKAASQDFDLADAVAIDEDVSTNPPATPPSKPAAPQGGIGADLDLSDAFDDDDVTTTKAPPKVVPKATSAPAKPKPKPDESVFPSLRPELLPPRSSSKSPILTRAPPRARLPASDDFDLADALDPNNDVGGKDKNKGQGDKEAGGTRGDGPPNTRESGGSFSDDDLTNVGKDDTYKPDKGKGGQPGAGGSDTIDQSDENYDNMAETGTIAGIVSAVAMALVGAVSSYISYQKKKFCFSIQQSLNTDMVKAENPEAVVATEPQVQQTLLEPANAEPPSEENAV